MLKWYWFTMKTNDYALILKENTVMLKCLKTVKFTVLFGQNYSLCERLLYKTLLFTGGGCVVAKNLLWNVTGPDKML